MKHGMLGLAYVEHLEKWSSITQNTDHFEKTSPYCVKVEILFNSVELDKQTFSML